ncbi:MAG: hypothetical protein OEY77_14205, partial [Nitrospira sp.]|nr:hypothetical protein [Nitrospira sp.]
MKDVGTVEHPARTIARLTVTHFKKPFAFVTIAPGFATQQLGAAAPIRSHAHPVCYKMIDPNNVELLVD